MSQSHHAGPEDGCVVPCVGVKWRFLEMAVNVPRVIVVCNNTCIIKSILHRSCECRVTTWFFLSLWDEWGSG